MPGEAQAAAVAALRPVLWSGRAVDAVYSQPEHEPTVGDHGSTEVIPVRMLARDGAVDLDQLLDGSVARIGRDGRQLGNAVANRPAPEVSTGHVDARPRIAAHVADLDSSVGHGDAHQAGLGIVGVTHVRQLRTPVRA